LPSRWFPVIPGAPPAAGTRNKLLELGPEKFAEWVRKQKRLLFTDTTMRDAHQSLLATRVRTHDCWRSPMRGPSDAGLVQPGDVGRGDVRHAMRFLQEDPWDRLDQLRTRIPNILFQMLLRASNAVGYTNYPDNVVREFVTKRPPSMASMSSAFSIR
jgi:pyruvate carboxylase